MVRASADNRMIDGSIPSTSTSSRGATAQTRISTVPRVGQEKWSRLLSFYLNDATIQILSELNRQHHERKQMGMGLRKGRDCKWLMCEDGKLLGISFGADFCAEHEWGIKPIKKIFGINDELTGVAKRAATIVPPFAHLRYGSVQAPTSSRSNAKKTDVFVIRCQDYFSSGELGWYGGRDKLVVDSYFSDPECLWSESGFAIATQNKAYYEQLVDALIDRNVCIGLFGGMVVFSNAGLTILIKSRIPNGIADQWLAADLDAISLQKASDETGIIAKIKAANDKYVAEQNEKGARYVRAPNEYYACRPSWNNDKKVKTKWRVVYWLNPCNQSQNQYGWFTAEELELWLEGKGPIKQMDKRK